MLMTIGYERADLADFLATLKLCKVEILVDIRDRAQSRRPGFSKSALSAALSEVDIAYTHLRELGDPKEGRDAARAGDFDHFNAIFREVLASNSGKRALAQLETLASYNTICLMCYERDQETCHRKIVAEQLERSLKVKTKHLGVRHGVARGADGRVLGINQSTATSV